MFHSRALIGVKLLIGALCLASGTAIADAARYQLDGQGFVVGLNTPAPADVVKSVQALRRHLFQRREKAVAQVAAGRIDGKRAAVALIMPGGMLYTAVKKAKAREARAELERIDAEIAILDQDLARLVRASGADELVAQAGRP